MNKHLLENNVFERMRRLMRSDKPNFLELERIDRDITQACAHGENFCRKRRLDYWSVDLHVAKRDLSIWAIAKSRLRRKLSIESIVARAKSLGIKLNESTPTEIIHAKCTTQSIDLMRLIHCITHRNGK